MAQWKKIISSGSKAHLSFVNLGTAPATDSSGNNGGFISSSGEITVTTVEDNTTDLTKVVTYKPLASGTGTQGEFMHIPQSTLTNTFSNALSPGPGLSGTSFDGGLPKTFTTDNDALISAAAGSGLTSEADTGKLAILQVPTVSGLDTGSAGAYAGLAVDSASLSDSNKGLIAGENGIGLHIDNSTLTFVDGALTKAFVSSGTNHLTTGSVSTSQAHGVLISGDANFNYGSARNINLDFRVHSSNYLGDFLLSANGTDISIASASNALQPTTNKLLSSVSSPSIAFKSASISSTTDTITIEAVNETVILGDLAAAATNFAHESNLEIADAIIVLNSGSSRTTTDSFGFVGQTGSVADRAAVGFRWSGSVQDPAWYLTQKEGNGDEFGTDTDYTKEGIVRIHLGDITGDMDTLVMDQYQKVRGYTLRETGEDAMWMYV